MTRVHTHRWCVVLDKRRKATVRCRLCDAPFSEEKTPKYRNRITAEGASTLEVQRGAQLHTMQRLGLIRNLRTQVRYLLIPKQAGERAVNYVADFVYELPGHPGESVDWIFGATIVEDTKGIRTREYIIKRKLMLWVHGIRITEIERPPRKKRHDKPAQ